MKYYTGIGSRKTPEDILAKMHSIGKYLGDIGYTLRSGGAGGADKAFELGASESSTSADIYFPWAGFADEMGEHNYHTLNKSNFEHVWRKYEDWDIIPWRDRLSFGAKKLHARNYFQIFGYDNILSDFVVYWAEENNGEISGGTRTAIVLARKFGVPTFNLKKSIDEFRTFVLESAQQISK